MNDDPVHNGKDQFMQWVTVDPADGSAYVMFYDRRGDSTNVKPIVVLARSTDGGRSFVNYAWTDVAFDANDDAVRFRREMEAKLAPIQSGNSTAPGVRAVAR